MNSHSKHDEQDEKRVERQRKAVSDRRKATLRRVLKRVLVVVAIAGVVGWLGWKIASRPEVAEADILSRNGLHWHADFNIFIKGEQREIPGNIGLVGGHQSMHTHEPNVIHIEAEGVVTKEMTTLGRFFSIWGKQFTDQCLFEFCTGADGTLRMTVNGEPNQEFGRYHIQDGDKFELRYE